MADKNTTESKPASAWSDWATRTTAILAVVAALSSGRWGASNLRAILEQGKVNDTWALYQAKSIKAHGAESTRDLANALAAGQSGDKADALALLAHRASEEAARESADKDKQMLAAREFERSRDRMVERGFWFEISFAALQLGVILCTVASAANKKSLWYFSILLGVVGMAVLINGFHTFQHAPRSWYEGTAEDMSYNGKTPPQTP